MNTITAVHVDMARKEARIYARGAKRPVAFISADKMYVDYCPAINGYDVTLQYYGRIVASISSETEGRYTEFVN